MNSLLKKNLFIGYSISLLLLIVSSVASYSSIQNLIQSQYWVNHTNQVINKLENIISVLKDAETGQRGFLLTGDETFLAPYNGAFDKEYNYFDQIKELTDDNKDQQRDIEYLRNIVTTRLSHLQNSITSKRNGQPVAIENLRQGKIYMDQAREVVSNMENREQSLLTQRNALLNKYTSTTPILIVVAAILALVVTIFSFIKTNADLNKRMQLQEELQKKDENITKRITLIRSIAGTISEGNYKTRITDEGKDTLGNLAGIFNRMAQSLDTSFENISNNEWLQKGIAELNEKMIGEKNLDRLAKNVIEFVTSYVEAPVGAFYFLLNRDLILASGTAINDQVSRQLTWGEGIAGQCVASGKEILISDIDETDFTLNTSSGNIKPRFILAVPVMNEGFVNGVIEIGFIKPVSRIVRDLLQNISRNVGTAVYSARNHQRLQELLQEVQAQSEELQAQHSELENINTELEAQTERLQASEEELKVQQEELQQANQELEERSRLLEEKNELIVERNLEVQAKAKELEIATRYKSEFLANMSHELRTPLNSILLLSRLLSENHNNNLSKDQVEYATVIKNSGTGLLTLINEILDLSKIEAGKMEMEFTEFNVQKLIDETRLMFAPMAKDKNISFNINTENIDDEKIETDRLRLEQILRNLISNALKFTKHGSVTLNVQTENNFISFSVKDTGIGIPKEKQQTIFEVFRQADGSTQRQYGGTGLGLSISQQLAKLLGGKITVSSEEGKGSDFVLTIPVNRNVAQEIPEPVTIIEPFTETKKDEFIAEVIPESIPDDRNNIVPGDKLILIIEDDVAFAKSLLEFTRKNNYKGIIAVRGDEGVELALKYLPNGVLLDVQLPVKSGWDVMNELKATAATRNIPVHMMSSFEVRDKSISIGAKEFIHKPVAFEKMSEIFLRIENALSKQPQKVFIIEENTKHAQALSYFLKANNIVSEIKNSVEDCIRSLNNKNVDCVILDTGFSSQELMNTLEQVKKTPSLENIPVIIFTAKNLSAAEELRIKQYADSIVLKTAHSYQRILDEVSLFLHLVEEGKKEKKVTRYKKLGELGEVLKNKTVLIADDDVRNIFSLTKSLEHYGMQIISAMDGKEAITQLNKNKVDIILMDMMMPEMDGFESIKRIRSNNKYFRLPIIAVTAKAMAGDREKCISAGASDYIIKPVDVDQLTSLLRVWLYEA